jgi:hypothetical protein
MLEWLAIIVGFVVLHKFRARLESLDEVVSELRTTVYALRAKLAAYERIGASPVTQAPMPAAPADARPDLAPPAAPPAAAPAPAPSAPMPRPVFAQREALDALGKRQAASPVVPPPLPPRGPDRRATPPAPPKPPFDWEKLIGVKLFSWIASAALALAAVFFLRYSMDHGWLTPEIRLGIGLVVGVALLVVCELKVARRYSVTANAMDAAGIAILFATVFASYALWHLVPSVIAFALLVLVTAVAVLLSIRRESMFIALLGLLGGFSTPVLLSSGQDNPLGLFSYLLLLNGGLAWVAYKKRWPLLTALSMVLSTLYQWGWVVKFLSVDRLPLAAGVFLVFALFSVVALALGNRGLGKDRDDAGGSPLFAPSLFADVARVSAALPLIFSIYLATIPAYGAHYGILFGFLFCLAAGLFVVGIVQGPHWLHALGAITTLATFAIWFSTSYSAAAWPWVLALVSAFVLFYLGAPAIARWWRDAELEGRGAQAVLVAPALLFAFPLLFAIEPKAASPGLPFGVLFALLAACAVFAVVARAGVVHYVAAFFAIAAEAVWSSQHLDPSRLYSALALYGAFGLFYVGAPLAARRWKRPFQPAGAAGALTLASLALLGYLATGPAAASALWGMALLIAVLNVGLYLESSADGLPAISIAGAVLSWIVLALWWNTAGAAAIVPALAAMAGFALLTMGGSVWARRRAGDATAQGFDANVFLGLVGHVFVAFVIMRPELSLPPWPVLGALAVLDLAVLVAALYLRNGLLHLAASAGTAVILMLWMTVAGSAPWPEVATLAAGAAVLLAFAALPLAHRVGARNAGFELAAGVSALLAQGVVILAQMQPGSPSLGFLVAAQLAFVAAVLSLSWLDAEEHGSLAALAVLPAAALAAVWQVNHAAAADWARQLALALPAYLAFTAYPLLLGSRARGARGPYVATVLANVAFFFLARHSLMLGGYGPYIGALPVVQAVLLLPVLARLAKLERASANGGNGAALASGRLALVAAAALACVTVAIPLQLEKNWITIGWAFEGVALVWLYRRIPHQGLFVGALALLGTAFVRLALNPAVLTYHARGAMPILNWYLYTYLLVAAAMFAASRLMAGWQDSKRVANALAAGGTVLLFLLLNIEIADYHATGPALTFNFNANLAQDLSYTIGWAVFSLGLLGAGVRLKNRACRMASIALLAVTVAKCFLHDLGRLGGLYRVGSFVGLALCLALVAIVLQKFVLARGEPRLTEA